MPARADARQHLYADPRVYDVLHAPGTKAEVSTLLRLTRAALARSTSAPTLARRPLVMLEPASGTGRYLIELARRGNTGLGLDLLAPMTAYARREARRVLAGRAGCGRCRFVTGDMTSFAWGDVAGARRASGPARADAAFCLINSIRHLMSDRAMLAHLACVRTCLGPGGVYVVGIETVEPAFAQETEDVWVGVAKGPPRMRVQQVVQFIPASVTLPDASRAPLGVAGSAQRARPQRERIETVHSHLTIRVGGEPERHTDSTYRLRTYTHAEWTGLIAKAGWRVLGVYNAQGEARPSVKIGYYLWVIAPG